MQRIDADILIPGSGEPVHEGSVLIDDGTITYAGPRANAPNHRVTQGFEVPVVMPGMWDCHCHFSGILHPHLGEFARTPTPVAAVRVVADAKAALMAGFTSIREPGGLGVYLARAIDEGSVIGPYVYGAGAMLSQTGGHGDIHDLPLAWMPELADRHGFFGLCDGIDECLKAVRSQLRLGAAFIKVCASGGLISELDDPLHQQFSETELATIVAEAKRFDRIVAAHCHGKASIMAALKAGCKTIEHGSYLDEECADAMKADDAILVPTRYVIEYLTELGQDQGLPAYALKKLTALRDQHTSAIKLAIEKGVTIALGTDIFASGDQWGTNGRELRYLVEAGMTPLDAIESATVKGPLTLGLKAPTTGRLEEDYVADVIAVAESPIENVDTLAESKNVTHVWKGGVLVKETSD